jgi:hypothetical protein
MILTRIDVARDGGGGAGRGGGESYPAQAFAGTFNATIAPFTSQQGDSAGPLTQRIGRRARFRRGGSDEAGEAGEDVGERDGEGEAEIKAAG